MDEAKPLKHGESKEPKKIPTVSRVFDDGRLLELVYDPKEKTTAFAVWENESTRIRYSYKDGKHGMLTPYSPQNNLITNSVILFPSEPDEYGTSEELVAEIQSFIHRHVAVTPRFERIASYYVLLTWLYDTFNELPYLRVRGDYGSGKTRFLMVVGSLCYKPIFASGASTIAPIFHILDSFGGTYIIDEADFLFSDEKADMVKILNNGNMRGIPILRIETTPQKEFNPRAYRIFGPKLVAMRGTFQDRALESRFISEQMGNERMREDIETKLPDSLFDEALSLRNKLLLFRFRNFTRDPETSHTVDPTLEPRLNQVFQPLLSVMKDQAARDELKELAREINLDIIAERRLETEAQVLLIIRRLFREPTIKRPTIGQFTDAYNTEYGKYYERPVTANWIGNIVRKKLGIKTARWEGKYVIPPSEETKLRRLYEKYGLEDDEQQAGDTRRPTVSRPNSERTEFPNE